MAKRGRWPGTWLAICDRCGFEFPSHMLRKDWQGLMVCEEDFETRHPQDFIRGIPDNPTPPWTRPALPDTFVHVCDLWTSSAYADYGTADCATVGRTPSLQLLADTFAYPAIADIAIASLSIAHMPEFN